MRTRERIPEQGKVSGEREVQFKIQSKRLPPFSLGKGWDPFIPASPSQPRAFLTRSRLFLNSCLFD